MALASFIVNSGFTANDVLQINSVVDSSSTTSGALQVLGGTGIGGKLYVGGGIHATTGAFSSTITATQLTSTIAQGTAPFVVTSTTAVINLKSDWVVTNANMTGPITGTGNVTSITSQTGTGTKFVMDTSPLLVTPNIGVATATSVNGLTITSSTGTLTIANGKTLSVNKNITVDGTDGKTITVTNSVAFSGTDNSTLVFRAGGQVAYTDKDKLSAFLATTSSELATVISDETGTGVLVFGTSPAITTSLTTPSTSFDLINTTATTVNFAKDATTLSIGAATGTTTINNNLQVAGDIYFNGTTSKLSTTNIEVNDALLYFGANNIGDIIDLGWIGRYNNGTTNDAHLGFIRSASDKEWKLFSNITTEPTTTVDLTSASYDNLRIGKLTTTGVNKVVITAPTNSATLTLADGSTLATVGGYSTTITSTAVTTVTLPTSGLLVNTAVTTLSSLAAVGTITSGTWSATFGAVSGANLTSLTAGNLTGTIPSTVLGNSTVYVGTTAVALNRASVAQTLSGISIDGNAATVTNGVYTTGTYADPAWLTSLAYSKLTGTPSSYSLPIASTTGLGGVKVDGTTITINASTGVISGANTYTLPVASTTESGGVKVDGTTITINSGVISSAGGLKSTPIKIASYLASAFDLVRCNTTNNTFSVTLPASPTDGAIIGIIDTHNTFYTKNLTVLPNTGQTIEGDSTSMVFDVNGSYMAFVYIAATSNWKMLETPVNVGTSTPIIFSAYPNVVQNLPAATYTKVLYQATEFNTNSYYNTSTSQFVPLVAGYYQVNAAFALSGASTEGYIQIRKNGSAIKNGTDVGGTSYNAIASAIVYLNGSTDYLEIFGYSGTSLNISANQANSFFQACQLR